MANQAAPKKSTSREKSGKASAGSDAKPKTRVRSGSSTGGTKSTSVAGTKKARSASKPTSSASRNSPEGAATATRKKATSKPRQQRPTIGWREWVSIPELGVETIKAKVDTGAATSALHVTNLKRRKTEDGTWLDFVVHPVQRHATPNIATGAWMVDERPVRDSGGRSEVRPVIRTTVEVGGRAIEIEITLTRRDNMGFRMLLGRQAIRRRFVVDPGRSFVKRDQKS